MQAGFECIPSSPLIQASFSHVIQNCALCSCRHLDTERSEFRQTNPEPDDPFAVKNRLNMGFNAALMMQSTSICCGFAKIREQQSNHRFRCRVTHAWWLRRTAPGRTRGYFSYRIETRPSQQRTVLAPLDISPISATWLLFSTLLRRFIQMALIRSIRVVLSHCLVA
jgi:hypothetical protein